MTHQVFVSYAKEDQAAAKAVCKHLEKAGIGCWIALRDLQGGQDWAATIAKAVKKCRVLVVVFSARANQSLWVCREVDRAIAGRKTIIPFRIEKVRASGAMDLYLATTQWLDAAKPPRKQHLDHLCDTVNGYLSKPAARRRPVLGPHIHGEVHYKTDVGIMHGHRSLGFLRDSDDHASSASRMNDDWLLWGKHGSGAELRDHEVVGLRSPSLTQAGTAVHSSQRKPPFAKEQAALELAKLEWHWVVNLAYGYSSFLNLIHGATRMSAQKYERMGELVRRPAEELGMFNLSIPAQKECSASRATALARRISARLRSVTAGQGRGFGFLWQMMRLIQSDDESKRSEAKRRVLVATLERSAREAGLLDRYSKSLIGRLSHGTFTKTVRKAMINETIKWAQSKGPLT